MIRGALTLLGLALIALGLIRFIASLQYDGGALLMLVGLALCAVATWWPSRRPAPTTP